MSTLYLVRHGPTHQRNFTGWRDVPADLSDHAKVARVAAFLPDDGLMVSSDLLRARQTADALQGHRVRLPHHSGLREFNFGTWEGKHWSVLPEAESRAYWEQPGDTAPPGGESWNEAAHRVSAAVDSLRANHPGDLIIVAHFGAILTQIARAAGITPQAALSETIEPLSITVIPHGQRPSLINHKP
ncbi:MAG: histidine phosphatase family protein [Shimia sp.]